MSYVIVWFDYDRDSIEDTLNEYGSIGYVVSGCTDRYILMERIEGEICEESES